MFSPHRIGLSTLVLILLVIPAIRPCWAVEPATEKAFRAGVAKVVITPWIGISLNGGMRDRNAIEVHDDLHARALVLDDGSTQLAIVVCDSCMIPREVFDAAKQLAALETRMKTTNMLCSATHTHSAPSSASVFQSDSDPRYQKFLAEKIAESIVAAHANLQPARIGWGNGAAPEHVHNRRWYLKPDTMPPGPFAGKVDGVKMNPPRGSDILLEPAGPIDPVVSILSVQTAEGRPLCLLANYSLHYVGGTGGGNVSADYFGAFAQSIGAKLKEEENAAEEFMGIMSNGTSGDINNINFREIGERQAPYEQINHVAQSVAEEALRVYREVKHNEWVQLGVAQAELQLGVRKPTEDELEEAKKIVAAVEGPEMKSLAEVYARETLLISTYPDTVPVLVQAVRIGDCAIAAIPCETFAEIGLELREKSPFEQTFTVELANGYNGYLPTPKQHELGGYETWRARSSYLEEGASPKIVDAIDGLFDALNE